MSQQHNQSSTLLKIYVDEPQQPEQVSYMNDDHNKSVARLPATIIEMTDSDYYNRHSERTGQRQQPPGFAHDLVLSLLYHELIPFNDSMLNGRGLVTRRTRTGVSAYAYVSSVPLPAFNVNANLRVSTQKIEVTCAYKLANEDTAKEFVEELLLDTDFSMDQLGAFIADFRRKVFAMLNAYTKGEAYTPTSAD